MIVIDNDECGYCGSCVAICPENCIDLFEEEIDIDNDICIDCKLCIYVCPVEALNHVETEKI